MRSYMTNGPARNPIPIGENEYFHCNCGGEIQYKNSDYVLHRCRKIEHGMTLIPYTRVLINPKAISGARKFQWHVDWKD
jgi:hypothetical protein